MHEFVRCESPDLSGGSRIEPVCIIPRMATDSDVNFSWKRIIAPLSNLNLEILLEFG